MLVKKALYRTHVTATAGRDTRVLLFSLPGLARAEAGSLVEEAHIVCPYSNATRGNIPIRLVLA
jgi:hypothetical protein